MIRELALYGRAALSSSMTFWQTAFGLDGAQLGRVDQSKGAFPGCREASPGGRGSWLGAVLALANGATVAVERLGLALGDEPPNGLPAPEGPTFQQVGDRQVHLPARIRDASQGLVVYGASLEAVRRVLESDGCPFEPVEIGAEQTAIGIFLVSYRDTDLGVYDELGISCTVTPRGRPDMPIGRFIRHLFVNESFTRNAGREVWGYPKEIQELDLVRGEGEASCTLIGDGRRLLSLTLPREPSSSTAAVAVRDYTVLNGVPHRTTLHLTSADQRFRIGGEGVSLSLGASGEHAASDFLRSVNLSEAPLLQLWTERLQGSLSGPQPLGPRQPDTRPANPSAVLA